MSGRRRVFARKETTVDPTMVRIVCAALAVVLLGLIVFRRKNKAE